MKKKVLLFSDCYLFGGSEHVAVNLLKNEYLREKYDVSFAYRKHRLYTKSLRQLFTNEQISFFFSLCLCSNATVYYRIAEKVRNRFWRRFLILPFWCAEFLGIYEIINGFIFYCLLKKLQPDLIHINNGGYPAAKTCLQLARIAHKLQFKVIMQVNNIAEVVTSGEEKETDKKIDCAVSCFITASLHAKKMLAVNRNFSSDKIKVIHNAVEAACVRKDRMQILNLHGLSQDRIILVEVALLQERKGQLPLLESLVFLRETKPLLFENITLFLIGTGENEQMIRTYIHANGLESSVMLLGYRFDYADYLNAADVVLLPSLKDEDMPLIILSAMALGKAIVSTAIAGIPEEIENGVSGYLLDPAVEHSTFVCALGKTIDKAIQNKYVLGKCAKEKFDNDFSVRKYTEDIDALYLRCCS